MNERPANPMRLRATAAMIWFATAAAVFVTTGEVAAHYAGLAALLSAAAAGQFLPSNRLVVAASLGLGTLALVMLWAAGDNPEAGALGALSVAASCLVARWSRATAPPRPMAAEQGRQLVAAPAGSRLPAGVADEQLLERLAVHEMTRARRYEHPLTLLLIEIDGWPAVYGGRERRAVEERLAALATRARRLLRDVDAIGLHGDSQLAVLLPETPLDGALVVAARIEETARQDLDLSVLLGAAVFPDDAVTVESLLHEAGEALELARLEGTGIARRVVLR
ncbi:MAG: diguanylate cyclase [Chloroflexi bacterium]|nr:diguanylate cyclase [Chloroflexota bacterium]